MIFGKKPNRLAATILTAIMIAAVAAPASAGSSVTIILDQTITKSGLEKWAADKCSLNKDPIKDKYRDLPMVGIYMGNWDGGTKVNFLIYKVKGDGRGMGDVKLYYANAPFDYGGTISNGGCWEEHDAKIEADGSVTLAVPRNGSKIAFTVTDGVLKASYEGKGRKATGSFAKVTD